MFINSFKQQNQPMFLNQFTRTNKRNGIESQKKQLKHQQQSKQE